MARQVSTYFHRMQSTDDMRALQREHNRQFPGNRLAILKGETGVLVKVAYPLGTAKPRGAISFADAKAEVERVAEKERIAGNTTL